MAEIIFDELAQARVEGRKPKLGAKIVKKLVEKTWKQ